MIKNILDLIYSPYIITKIIKIYNRFVDKTLVINFKVKILVTNGLRLVFQLVYDLYNLKSQGNIINLNKYSESSKLTIFNKKNVFNSSNNNTIREHNLENILNEIVIHFKESGVIKMLQHVVLELNLSNMFNKDVCKLICNILDIFNIISSIKLFVKEDVILYNKNMFDIIEKLILYSLVNHNNIEIIDLILEFQINFHMNSINYNIKSYFTEKNNYSILVLIDLYNRLNKKTLLTTYNITNYNIKINIVSLIQSIKAKLCLMFMVLSVDFNVYQKLEKSNFTNIPGKFLESFLQTIFNKQKFNNSELNSVFNKYNKNIKVISKNEIKLNSNSLFTSLKKSNFQNKIKNNEPSITLLNKYLDKYSIIVIYNIIKVYVWICSEKISTKITNNKFFALYFRPVIQLFSIYHSSIKSDIVKILKHFLLYENCQYIVFNLKSQNCNEDYKFKNNQFNAFFFNLIFLRIYKLCKTLNKMQQLIVENKKIKKFYSKKLNKANNNITILKNKNFNYYEEFNNKHIENIEYIYDSKLCTNELLLTNMNLFINLLSSFNSLLFYIKTNLYNCNALYKNMNLDFMLEYFMEYYNLFCLLSSLEELQIYDNIIEEALLQIIICILLLDPLIRLNISSICSKNLNKISFVKINNKDYLKRKHELKNDKIVCNLLYEYQNNKDICCKLTHVLNIITDNYYSLSNKITEDILIFIENILYDNNNKNKAIYYECWRLLKNLLLRSEYKLWITQKESRIDIDLSNKNEIILSSNKTNSIDSIDSFKTTLLNYKSKYMYYNTDDFKVILHISNLLLIINLN